MCGVVGLIYERERSDLGRIAAELLKTLEYRGYDSTGAAIQGRGREVRVVKGVGAPSLMVHSLGIVEMGGQILCGQVRWATFGAVSVENSQPHAVACKEPIYGAHNGNVTNCDQLKTWLTDEGHRVVSDNDGEMVVHTVEHYFARELAGRSEEMRRSPEGRRLAMRAALAGAAARLEGSYAAVIVDPESRTLWAVKQGSSLYFGMGRDEIGGSFAVASSDLSSVLKLTRVLVPMCEGEVVEYDAAQHRLYSLTDHTAPAGPAGAPMLCRAGEPIERSPLRSRLRVKDTALMPAFQTFMEQEISAQAQALRGVTALFLGGTEAARVLRPYIEAHPPSAVAEIRAALDRLLDQYDDERIRPLFHELVDLAPMRSLIDRVPATVAAEGTSAPPEQLADRLLSSDAGFLTDLLQMARDARDLLAVRLLDVLLEREEVREFASAIDSFVDFALASERQGGRLLVLSCGSSYNAARAASLFFNEMAHANLTPLLPGEFREREARSLRDGDLVIAVSQSGETKDLIDVMNDVAASGRSIRRVAIVNNVNSTLAQEKSDLVIPLRCGPEIAVPATKSFMNQMALFYGMALRLGERRLAAAPAGDAVRPAWAADLARRRERLMQLPALIHETLSETKDAVDEAAQLLYLRPSIHLLATRLTGLAREGALKIREVVLNHAEGFEASEFKHGPNTILGVNTVLGPQQLELLLRHMGALTDAMVGRAVAQRLGPGAIHRLIQAASDMPFASSGEAFALEPDERAIFDEVVERHDLFSRLYADYPLLYLTGPDERDLHLTISQINTHKIRGAMTVVVAEDDAALRQAATKSPSDNPRYRSVFIELPRTGDTLMTVFSATVVLQRLALEMSLLKMRHLDRLGFRDHGVHPDVPKNVSKSITVD